MGFVDAIKTCLSKYIDFQGRARRSEFWFFQLALLIGGLITQIFGDAVNILFSLVTFLPALSASVRRLHDTDRNGWWILLFLIPVVGWIILLVFYVQKGTDGFNQYGDDPITGQGDMRNPNAMDDWRKDAQPTPFDDVMEESYRKSRIPRVDGDD